MNQRTDKAASGSGQAPLPPLAPRTTAPSPTKTGAAAELQKRSDSTPSFTKRKRMEKSVDEQRWKRTDLHLIQYMSKLKEEYMQRQTSSGQPSKKSAEVATHEKQDRAAGTHNSAQQQTERENPRVADNASKPSLSSVRDLPKSMIPVRSPPRVKSIGTTKGAENEEVANTRKDSRVALKMPKNANIKKAVTSGGSQNKDEIKDEAKEEDETRPQPSTSKDESPLLQYKAQTRCHDNTENDHLAANLQGLGPDHTEDQDEAAKLETVQGPSMVHLDALATKETNVVKRVSSSTAKIKTEKAQEESKLATTASRALTAKDNLIHRRGYQTQSMSKLKSTVSKVSATELKATTSERSARKTSSFTKTNIHPSLRRSRWSGMLIEDSKQKEKRGEPAGSPNFGRPLTSKEEQLHAKPRSSLQLRLSHGKLSSQTIASKQSGKLAEEDHYATMATALRKRSRQSSNPRDSKASRERVFGAKIFPGSKLSSPSRINLRKGSYQAFESSNEGSDEDLAACVRETPSVAVASVKQPTLISKSPTRKVTSYQLSPPPSSKKSISIQKANVKGHPFHSRSPVKDSLYKYSNDRQLSEFGVNESVSRSATDRDRQSSTMLSSPSKLIGRYKVGAGMVKRSLSQSSKVTDKVDGAVLRKYIERRSMGHAGVDRKLKRSRYTETSDLLPIERQTMQMVVENTKMPVENRCTQVESWPDDLENDNLLVTKQREGDHVSPKRTAYRAHHKDKLDTTRHLQRHLASCRYRPKIVCCHHPSFKVHGRSKGKKPKHRPHYKYIVDPSLYNYIRKIHGKKGTWRRKCDSLPYESAHRLDTSETSYTSLRELEISESSCSRSGMSTCSSEYSNSCSSSIIQRKSNTVACLSLKDTATLCWNMSESNVQVQSSTHTSSVHKMSKDKRSRMKKAHHRHLNHETASDRGPKKASKMNKDGRRAYRAPVTVPSKQNQVKPLRMDQPPEGPDARSTAQIRESVASNKEASIENNIASILEECASEQESKELDTLEAEISKAVEQLCMSQQEIEMKFEIVMESFNQLKENRRQILNDLAGKEREAKEASKQGPSKWEATYFDYFMFLTFLTAQIVFHIIFIKKL